MAALNWLCWLLTAIFTFLTIWSFLLRNRKDLPKIFFFAHGLGHLAYLLTIFVALIGIMTKSFGDIRGFWEYLFLFTGAGVVYARGLMPKGWVWRVLTDPPKVASGLMWASLWIAAAVLGFIARGRF